MASKRSLCKYQYVYSMKVPWNPNALVNYTKQNVDRFVRFLLWSQWTTNKSTSRSRFVFRVKVTATLTTPCLVNLTAFPIRFTTSVKLNVVKLPKTCRSLVTSPSTHCGTVESIWSDSFNPL